MNTEALRGKNVGVLLGGVSPERAISLRTGKAILKALEEKGYNAAALDVDHSVAEHLRARAIEVAFIALHGPLGEDGSVQGLLEMMGIPYTGSSVLASALAMNKVMSKKIFCYHQLPTPRFQVISYPGEGPSVTLAAPLVVKPVCGGSTIGISLVRSRDELEGALNEAAAYDREVLIEEYVDGVDITVGVLNGVCLPPIEIMPKSGFYDYESKYTPGRTAYLIPARLSRELTGKAQELGLAAYQALQCSGAARVDFRLDSKKNLTILEVNTIPGLTETSLLPMAAAHVGLDFAGLVEMILGAAQLHICAGIPRQRKQGTCS
jgi:D-alanine-D-alanine ligase